MSDTTYSFRVQRLLKASPKCRLCEVELSVGMFVIVAGPHYYHQTCYNNHLDELSKKAIRTMEAAEAQYRSFVNTHNPWTEPKKETNVS